MVDENKEYKDFIVKLQEYAVEINERIKKADETMAEYDENATEDFFDELDDCKCMVNKYKKNLLELKTVDLNEFFKKHPMPGDFFGKIKKVKNIKEQLGREAINNKRN